MTTGNVTLIDSPLKGAVSFDEVALHLHPSDDVAIAKTPISPGLVIRRNDSPDIHPRQFIPSGHKIALASVSPGQPLHRYGQIIGFATQAIQPGDHVHTHNLAVGDFARDYAFCADVQAVDYVPEGQRRAFMGYKRTNGKVGTRNYIAILASVNCSAHTIREITRYFTPEKLVTYPNVDGVIALTHSSGCGVRVGGADYQILQRTIAGMARHANVGAYLMVGLGCETNQIQEIADNYQLQMQAESLDFPLNLTIQGQGGIRKTVQAGIEMVERLLPLVNQTPRTPQPISELVLALKCGGSDSWSGITANPVLGLVADEVVRQGGTVALAETPEIYGAEHLLTRRAISREVGEKLVDKVHWWERHAAKHEVEIDNNPSAGNKVGGLTTILEKSLGAVAKSGSTLLTAVYDYAEPITEHGFVYVDTPGYDPVCVTGQVASGCTLVLFTTGRGSVFGYKPAPSIKITSNTAIYEHMLDDMDFNAGIVLDEGSLQQTAQELLDLTIAVASGQPSKSEAQGVGEAEFTPWNLGSTL
jgi:altronate hydrolase